MFTTTLTQILVSFFALLSMGNCITKRSAVITYSEKTWPIRTLVYHLQGFNLSEKKNIRSAMVRLETELSPRCISFVEKGYNNYSDYLEIQKSDTCGSVVGVMGGKQITRLAPGCVAKEGIIMHELLHVLGLKHEHHRPDRDDYVDIYYENIETSKTFAFRMEPDMETFDLTYDLESIMHFGEEFYAKRPGLKTIVAKNGQHIGQRDYLTENDKTSVKKLYKCDDDLSFTCEFTLTSCGFFTQDHSMLKWGRRYRNDRVPNDHSNDGYFYGIDMQNNKGASAPATIALPSSSKGYCISFWYYRYNTGKYDFFSVYKSTSEMDRVHIFDPDQDSMWVQFKKHYQWSEIGQCFVIYAMKTGGFDGNDFAIDDFSAQETYDC